MISSLPYTRTETLLSIENVSLSFGNHQVLRNINAKVDDLHIDNCVAGQVVAFLGRSGAGKSQLLRILAGLQKPTAGSVYVTEKRTPVSPGSVGMVMQESPLFHNRTVMGNLTLAAKQHGYTDVVGKEKIATLLDEFEMTDSRDKYPQQLSGGMRQRVAVLQQILSSEHFLLMDEPFSALDPVNVKKACELIAKVANQDELSTVIVVTHDIKAALAVADTVWILGRENGSDGNRIPSATIVREMNLIDMGLAWHSAIMGSSLFQEVEAEILSLFERL